MTVPVSGGTTAKWRIWALVAGLAIVLWTLYLKWPHDYGQELRRAVFFEEYNKAKALLKAHPEVVNQTFVLSVKAPPLPPKKIKPGSMNVTEEFTMFLWGKFVTAPIKGKEEEDRFEAFENEQTPALHTAVMKRNLELVQLLLEHGADVNQKTWGGGTAIFYAATRTPEMTRLLLEHGASVTITNGYGRTPLHMVVLDREGIAAKLLLEAGANPNTKDVGGWTPMHLAAYNAYQTNACAILLQHGARLDITNRAGKTPLDLAKDRDLTNAVDFLSAWPRQKPAVP